MYYVYVLESTDGKVYKGMTSSLVQRIKDHRRGKTKSTKRFKDIRLVYLEELPDCESARRREKYLKSAAGRKFLRSKLDRGP